MVELINNLCRDKETPLQGFQGNGKILTFSVRNYLKKIAKISWEILVSFLTTVSFPQVLRMALWEDVYI